jgi:Flp pilus assembly protein CpaB
MMRSKFLVIPLSVVFAIALLGVLRYKPWHKAQGSGEPLPESSELKIGFLPVT